MRRNGNDIHLGPSEYYWGTSPERILTVLGSCISITVWVPSKKCGGMCHFVISRSAAGVPSAPDPKYCEDAIAALLRRLQSEGVSPSRCEVKMTGGAEMFPSRGTSVGETNVCCAEKYLREAGFDIRARHTGGRNSRYIIFELETGDLWVRTAAGILIPENRLDAPQEFPEASVLSGVGGGANG